MRQRLLIIGAALLGVVLVCYALFWRKSERELILDKLAELEAAVEITPDSSKNPVLRAAGLKKEFAEIFVVNVAVSIPELSNMASGSAELAGLAARAGANLDSLDLDFSGIDLSINEATKSARLDTTATLTATGPGERVRRDQRDVELGFSKTDDGWRIDRVRVKPKPSQ